MHQAWWKTATFGISVAAAAVLTGCGGGGSASSPAPAPATVQVELPNPTVLLAGVKTASDGTLSASTREAIELDASASTATGNATLSFAWTVVLPQGSTLVVTGLDKKSLSFLPDVAGTYKISLKLTASDGLSTTKALNILVALPAGQTMPVPAAGIFKTVGVAPAEVRYSKSTDQFVFTTEQANTLYVVDPFTGVARTVDLLATPKRLQLSPDGKLAAVLYGTVVDLIDVNLAKRIRSSLLQSDRSDVVLLNSGQAYLLGGDQWSGGAPGFIDARTGVVETPNVNYAAGTYWGYGQRGVALDKINSMISASTGLSPSKLTQLVYDASSPAKVLSSNDWPYHGTYYASSPVGANTKQTLVFDESGLAAYTGTLKFAGRFDVTGSLRSVSASSDDSELLAVTTDYNQADGYASQYYRIDPELLIRRETRAFPKVEGVASYGTVVYHSSKDRTVGVARTADATSPGSFKYWTFVLGQ